MLKPGGLFVLCFADKSFMEKLPFINYGFKLLIEKSKRSIGKSNLYISVLKKEEVNNGSSHSPNKIILLLVKD